MGQVTRPAEQTVAKMSHIRCLDIAAACVRCVDPDGSATSERVKQ